MIEWIAEKLVDIRQLILALATVGAIVYVIGQWWRTKALVPTLTALLVAGLVLWAIANIEWFKDKIGEETAPAGTAAPVVRALYPPAGHP